MPLGNLSLTEVTAGQAQTEPGMAHFSGTGPWGTTCGHCIYWGYKREAGREKLNPQTGELYRKIQSHNGCKKYHELTGKHGPAIKAALPSCKYFDPALKPAA